MFQDLQLVGAAAEMAVRDAGAKLAVLDAVPIVFPYRNFGMSN